MPVISGGVIQQPSKILFQEVTFTETSVAGTYTGTVIVPANSWLLDIKIWNTVYWTSATSAVMDVGDVADPNGWFAGIDLKTTDIVDGASGDGEVIDFNNAGGKVGDYLVAATGERALMYASTERLVSGIIVTVTTAGSTAGRTRMLVIYTDPAVPGVATKV